MGRLEQAWATEDVPADVDYARVLATRNATPLQSLLGVGLGIVTYLTFAPIVTQLLALGYWQASGAPGAFADTYRRLVGYEVPFGMSAVQLGISTLIPISLALVLFVHRVRPAYLLSVRPGMRWGLLGIMVGVAAVTLNGVLLVQHLASGGGLTVTPQRDLLWFMIACLLTSPIQAAAEELFFNQSTVSAHISLLEQALGKELFVRSNRRHVRLTKEGEQVYPIARRILNDCAALRTLFSDADSAPVVALGASTVPGQYLVPGYLAAFLKREPEFRYSLRRGDSEQVHRMLKSGQIAVGFVGAVSEPENVDYFPLYDDRLVLAAPNNEHYRMLRERGVYGRELLLEEPFVSREEGSGTDTSLQNYLRTLGLSHDMLHVVARVDDPEAIKQMVSGGVGVAVLSALAVEQEVQNGTLLAFEMDKSALKRTIYLITLKSQQLSRMEQKLVDFLKSPHRRKRAEAQN